jgi:hypothetical protein
VLNVGGMGVRSPIDTITLGDWGPT